jgi:hypothetical protein
LANTALDTVPQNAVEGTIASKQGDSAVGEANDENKTGKAEVEFATSDLDSDSGSDPSGSDPEVQPKPSRAKPTSPVVNNANGNGIHVNGNSTESET